jgi:hypothetical protein
VVSSAEVPFRADSGSTERACTANRDDEKVLEAITRKFHAQILLFIIAFYFTLILKHEKSK